MILFYFKLKKQNDIVMEKNEKKIFEINSTESHHARSVKFSMY